jgi:hypothetical protein
MRAPHIKGAAVREFLRWYAERASPGALRAAVASLPEELRRTFDPDLEALGVLPSSWYESRAVHLLMDALFRAVPEHAREASIRDGARYSIDQTTRGIYRFIIARITPELYVRQVQRLWGLLHDNGEREIVMTGKTSCRSYTRRWPGHHPVLCQASTETMARVFELMGCASVRVSRIACVSDGAPECVADLRWTKE